MPSIHVAQFLKDDPGTRREVEIRITEPALGDVQLSTPIEGHADLVRTHRGILVTMDYRGTVELTCGRCINEYPYFIEDHFQDEVLAPVGESHERDSNRDDDAPRIGDDYMLDLDEIIRQELVMRTPLQPLCRPDCPGLCESCGADLRIERCSCDQIDSDSPFAALRNLLPHSSASPSKQGR